MDSLIQKQWTRVYKVGNWALDPQVSPSLYARQVPLSGELPGLGFLLPQPRLEGWCCSVVSDSATPWTAARQASLSITISWSLLKLMSIESVMPSNHLILCHPDPPAFDLSQHQGLFQGVSSSHQVVKVLELQLGHPSFQ